MEKRQIHLFGAETLHEWCRLVNLVERFQGEEGKQKLFDQWVANRAKAEKNARVYKAHVCIDIKLDHVDYRNIYILILKADGGFVVFNS